MFERLKYTELPAAAAEALSDLGDLVQSEIRLLKAELSGKLSTKLNSFVWLGAGGVLCFTAFLFVAQAAAVGIAAAGVPMPWALLIVALAIAIVGGVAIAKGVAGAKQDIVPNRSINQIRQDFKTAKERLS